jgi:hypothetical protein
LSADHQSRLVESSCKVLFDRTMRRKAAVEQPGEPAPKQLGTLTSPYPDISRLARQTVQVTPVVAVPVLSLRPADSPRLNGEDKAHIARLAEMDTPLPPILVDRRTMRVIDGMHRLMAASLLGR